MTVSPLLMRFVDDELARSPDLIARTLASVIERFRHPLDADLPPSDRSQFASLAQVLTEQGAVYQVAFLEALRALATAELDPRTAGRLPPLPGESDVMDEVRVESDIEIARGIALIEEIAAPGQRALQALTATLQGEARAGAESNPLRPQTYARAVGHAGTALDGLNASQRSHLLRAACVALAPELQIAWSRAAARLADQGVRPHGTLRLVRNDDDFIGLRPAPVDVTQPGALEGLLSLMPSATGAVSAQEPGLSRGRRDLDPGLDTTIGHLGEALALAATGSAVPLLADHQHALLAAAETPVDRQIIELMSRLSAALLADATLPADLRAPVARLQAAALRIALHDPFLLETHRHPVWLLLDRIAEAGRHQTPDDEASRLALRREVNAIVDGLLREPVQDTAAFRRALERLEGFQSVRLADALNTHRASIDQLQLAERIDQMREQISARLVEQMVRVRASAPIRRFVTGPWAHVLALAMLRNGDRSDIAISYMQAVDDLLWTLQVPDHPHSRARLLDMLPTLLQKLREGMALIDMPLADQEAVFDELMVVHTEAMRASGRAANMPEAPQTPQDIVQRLREESAPMPLQSDSPTFKDSLIDLGSLDTVPAEWLPSSLAIPGDDDPAFLQSMAPGERYRLFLHGRWSTVQLLWRSEHGQFLLFAGDLPGMTHSITQRALGKLHAANLLRGVDAKPLLQRAVDRMLRLHANGSVLSAPGAMPAV